MDNKTDMNKNKNKNKATAALTVLCVLLAAAALLLATLYIRELRDDGEPDEPPATDEPAITEPSPDFEAVIAQLEFEKAELESQAHERQIEIDRLTEELAVKDSLALSGNDALAAAELEYNRRTGELEGEIRRLTDEIEAVDDKIAAYKSISYLDIGGQAELVSELFELLAGEAPDRRLHRDTDETDDEGEPLRDDEGEVVQVEYTQRPKVALYYEDVTTGYSINYRGGDRFFAASIIKTPYVWAVFEEISAFEREKYDFTPSYEGETNPDLDEFGHIIYREGEEKYDLSTVWTYDRENMLKEGTGKIKDMDDGITLTYAELFRYAVEYSDNVAFAQLREIYGYSVYNNRAASLGVSVAGGMYDVSARGMGAFMRAIYDFIERDGKYGEILKTYMLDAGYRILIPYAVSPKVTAHKYGWDVDSYHDTAIVYDKYPYILVILTDMDTVGDAENTFIRKAAALVDDIHEGFYRGIDKSLLDRFEALVPETETSADTTETADTTITSEG